MRRDPSKERLFGLEVSAWVCREETKSMCAEEVVRCFIVQLARDSEEGEDFLPIEEAEGMRIEIDYGRSSSECEGVYLVA